MKRISLILVLLLLITLINTLCVNAKESTMVITDMESWNHPVKSVFAEFSVKVTRVELGKNKTYPTFFVEMDTDKLKNNRDIYFSNLINQVAFFNGFGSFNLYSEKYKFIVKCDKKSIKSIILNNEPYTLNKYVTYSNLINGKYVYEDYIYSGKITESVSAELDKKSCFVNMKLQKNDKVSNFKALLNMPENKDFFGGYFFYKSSTIGSIYIGLNDESMVLSLDNNGISSEIKNYYKKDTIDKIRKAYLMVTDEYAPEYYSRFYGFDENGDIFIIVSRSSDTVVQARVHVNPKTWEISEEE